VLTGRRATHCSSICAGWLGPWRINRPSQASAFGSEAALGQAVASQCNACASGAQVGLAGCARRLHQTASPTPRPHVGWAAASAISRSRRFFSEVCGIGTGDPVLGSRPADTEACQLPANGFPTDGPVREALDRRRRGHPRQRPRAGGVAKGARTLGQEGASRFAASRIEGRMGEPPWRRGAARQNGHAVGIEGINDMADRLIVAAQGFGNHAGGLAPGTGQQDLATAPHQGIG
jgi:hypothetical protein